MDRRRFAQVLPLALAAGCSAGSGSVELIPAQYADFNSWLQAARAAAKHLVDQGAARDAARFVQFLTLWAVAMPRFVVREWQEVKGANSKLEHAQLASGSPFAVTAFRMGPGCLQPVHCHPGAGGITLCLDGSMAIKHFDLMPGSSEYNDTGGAAEIAEVSVTHAHSGRFTSFTPSVANLHQLEAGDEGATGVEFLVSWRGTGLPTYLKLSQATPTAEGQISARHSGKWVGLDLSQANVA
jgi:2-aminoethanethiol dioxygenase/cysteine oxidase family protein